ncbi:hypothetical protein GIB67_026833 [Kingdonia uniflora]|uniref:Uncharacterized protein n=1 Tax=Kingdonia uniflora TaxID=39325 RepID=A0A7J7MHN5_9MAGN|nr:hypothetical protein GIB67_026833 [Kingdonia uniflora]
MSDKKVILITDIGSRTHELPTESNIEGLELDISSDESVASAVSSVIAKCGKIDIVINNAGVGSPGPLVELSLDEVRKTWELRPFGIQVLLVIPGAICSNIGNAGLKRVADKEWKLYSEFKEAIAERASASQTDKSSEATLFAKHVAKKRLLFPEQIRLKQKGFKSTKAIDLRVALGALLGVIRLSPSTKTINKSLCDVNGIVRPSRMTPLLGHPGFRENNVVEEACKKA